MTYTKDILKEQLKQMGLVGNEAIMVHSSMKAIGDVEGGADTVVDVFMEFFEEGLFMTPTHTWKQMSEEYNVFDPVTEPGCVGIIPNIFMKREGVVRSLHPTHSIAAYGKEARKFVIGEEKMTTPCGVGGCWDRLREVNAKILLVGVNHVKNTFIHSVEEVFDVPERFTDKPTLFKIKMPNGELREVNMYRHYNRTTDHISESFEKMGAGYLETGAATKAQLGDARCLLCDANKLFDVTAKILKKEINCFIEREEIPREWYI